MVRKVLEEWCAADNTLYLPFLFLIAGRDFQSADYSKLVPLSKDMSA